MSELTNDFPFRRGGVPRQPSPTQVHLYIHVVSVPCDRPSQILSAVRALRVTGHSALDHEAIKSIIAKYEDFRPEMQVRSSCLQARSCSAAVRAGAIGLRC